MVGRHRTGGGGWGEGIGCHLSEALKQKRTTYHLAEPVLRPHQFVTTPYEAQLTRHHGAAVWVIRAEMKVAGHP